MQNLSIDILSPYYTNKLYGTKATTLIELKNMGISIPEFWIIPSTSFSSFCQMKNIPSLNAFFSNPKYDNDIEKRFIDCCIENKEKIIETIGVGKFMVRSSSIPTKNVNLESFPSMISGAFDSFFANSSYRVIDCIPEVWRSVFSKKSYNQIRLFSSNSIIDGIGVLIQRYIEPIISGVAHIDENKASVNWINGHLSKIVNGEVLGDYFEIYKTPEDQYIIRGIEKNILNIINNNFESVFKSLFNIAVTIRHHFDLDQEIEWIYDGNQIWIIQSQALIKQI